jgi:outer membrane biosynthesis protein TonB
MSRNTVDTRSRLAPAQATVRDDYIIFAVIGALGLHAILIVAMLVTFASKLDIVDQTPMVPVDLVTIGPKTNVMAMAKPVKAPPKDVPSPPVKSAMQAPAPTPPSKAEPEPPKPTPPKPDETLKELLAPSPQAAKPKPPEKAKTLSQDQQMAALINKLAAPPAPPKNVKTGPRDIKGIGAQNAMEAELSAALASKIMQCWSPPVGAPKAEELVVEFDLFLNQDGSVARVPQLTADYKEAASRDPYTRAAADAAMRAIYDCAPYKLPADRYSSWKEINPFHFDPRAMMGQ